MPRTTRGRGARPAAPGQRDRAFSLKLPPQQRSTPRARAPQGAQRPPRRLRRGRDGAHDVADSERRAGRPALGGLEFFDEVRNGAVDEVTFAAEGGALVAVDADGGRHDVSILQSQVSRRSKLYEAKRVPFAVQAAQQQDGGLLGVVANPIVPVALLGGFLFLLRGGPGGQGGGPFGGGDGPMGMLQSRAKVEVEPETGADAA